MIIFIVLWNKQGSITKDFALDEFCKLENIILKLFKTVNSSVTCNLFEIVCSSPLLFGSVQLGNTVFGI